MAAENYQRSKVTNKLPATISNNQNISTWYLVAASLPMWKEFFPIRNKALVFLYVSGRKKVNVKIKTWQNFKDTRLIFLYLFSFPTEEPTLVFRIYFVLCCCYENWVSACGITTNATCALPFFLVGMSMSVSIRHKVQCSNMKIANRRRK